MQLQESQAFNAAVYQIFSPVINALLTFAASLALYWIKDRDPSTKEFERQTKRLQFWKTFYDLEAVVPIKPEASHHCRCNEALERAAFWVQAIPTRAHAWATVLAVILMGGFSSFIFTNFVTIFGQMFPPGPPPAPSIPQRAIVYLSFLLATLLSFYQLIFQPVRKAATKWLLALAEKLQWFAFLKEMKD